jgi:hypothetical protein
VLACGTAGPATTTTAPQAIVVDLQQTGVLRALFHQEEAEVAAAAAADKKAGAGPAQQARAPAMDASQEPQDDKLAALHAADADSRTGGAAAAPQANGDGPRPTASR